MMELRTVKAVQTQQALVATIDAYSDSIASGVNIKSKYADVANAITTHQQTLSIKDPFIALGRAHTQLRKIAKSGFESQDYQSFIDAIIEVKVTVDSFNQPQGSE